MQADISLGEPSQLCFPLLIDSSLLLTFIDFLVEIFRILMTINSYWLSDLTSYNVIVHWNCVHCFIFSQRILRLGLRIGTFFKSAFPGQLKMSLLWIRGCLKVQLWLAKHLVSFFLLTLICADMPACQIPVD